MRTRHHIRKAGDKAATDLEERLKPLADMVFYEAHGSHISVYVGWGIRGRQYYASVSFKSRGKKKVFEANNPRLEAALEDLETQVVTQATNTNKQLDFYKACAADCERKINGKMKELATLRESYEGFLQKIRELEP